MNVLRDLAHLAHQLSSTHRFGHYKNFGKYCFHMFSPFLHMNVSFIACHRVTSHFLSKSPGFCRSRGLRFSEEKNLSIWILRIPAHKHLNRRLPKAGCLTPTLRPDATGLNKPRTTAPQVNRGVVDKVPNEKADPPFSAFINLSSLNDLLLQRCRIPPIHHVA